MKHTDEHLADSTAHRKAHDIVPHAGMPAHKSQSGGEFAAVSWVEIHAEILADAGVDEVRGEGEVGEREQCAEEIVGAHHGRTFVIGRKLEDVVLRGVGEAVEEQVHGEQEQAPRNVAIGVSGRLGGFGARVQRENSDAAGDGKDD